jgi:hypothetical protein
MEISHALEKLFTHVTGSIDQELQLRNEYLITENRILRWHANLVARFDGASFRRTTGRPAKLQEIGAQILRSARENMTWGAGEGYARISGALKNLGHRVSDATVANVLKRHGLPPAGDRKKETTWTEFINSPMDVLTDFYTAEVWSGLGLRAPVNRVLRPFLHSSGHTEGEHRRNHAES